MFLEEDMSEFSQAKRPCRELEYITVETPPE
jgi:hypothetical protein